MVHPGEPEIPLYPGGADHSHLASHHPGQPPASGPREQMLIVDYDKWGYRINNWYVPLDADDEARHNAELRLE